MFVLYKYSISLVCILIKEYFHKDDLVQMFGYYQYQKNYTINLHYSNPALSEITFWKILESVSQGILVGNLVDIKELSYVYKIEKEELISKLKELKSLGLNIELKKIQHRNLIRSD